MQHLLILINARFTIYFIILLMHGFEALKQ